MPPASFSSAQGDSPLSLYCCKDNVNQGQKQIITKPIFLLERDLVRLVRRVGREALEGVVGVENHDFDDAPIFLTLYPAVDIYIEIAF